MQIWNLWHADYWLAGAVKAVTALASVPTAILLVQLVPKALGASRESRTGKHGLTEHAPSSWKRSCRQARKSSKGLLESAPDAMVITNRQGSIELINAQTEKLFCYPRAELLGKEHGRPVPGEISREAQRTSPAILRRPDDPRHGRLAWNSTAFCKDGSESSP